MQTKFILPTALALGLPALVAAQGVIPVTADIAVSTTWTSNNIYDLQAQVYVLPGATLTIEAGTVIATSVIPGSNPPSGGSLAVTRGARIFVLGTETRPVIMTSAADRATWSGGNPRTGTWREAANEWGNLTIMGSAYIAEDAVAGNTATFNANNVGVMEGLTAQFPGDTRVLYGGGNDDDDSGSISYLSIRYGGRVIGLNNELNGLSLGGVGRATDIHHVEIMNNVDDGIEIWGGTVNLKYFSIWNVGDDSCDVDQGWRGKAQFGLIVQGYSLDAAQGSGVGDNCFETDGAEDSHYQPVTTATIYNCTVIGQPVDGDHGTAWRDNARVQYRNCIFMDLGERLVQFDNVDGDGAHGYGWMGTLSWPQTWTTPANPTAQYPVQTSGNLAEIKDSVFYNNNFASAYTEANNRGVNNPANNNVIAASSPIASLTRAAGVLRGGKLMVRVTSLDPRPANDALSSVAWAPNDGFFDSARYRGAFAPGNNWLCGWTASSAYGFTPNDTFCDLGYSLTGTTGAPVLAGSGSLSAGGTAVVTMNNAAPTSLTLLNVAFGRIDLPFLGGTIVPNYLVGALLVYFTSPSGGLSVNLGPIPPGFTAGTPLYLQGYVFDAGGPQGVSASNAIVGRTP